MIDFATNIGLALIGLTVYSLWAVRARLKEFNIGIFIKDNKAFWIWAFLLQIAMASLVAFSPDNASALKGLIGIDFAEPSAFITSGWMLSIAANAAVKDKIGRKNVE